MVPTSRHTPPVTYHPPPHCGCHVVLDFTRLCPNLSTIPFSHLMGLWVVPGTFKHESGSKGKPTNKMCKFCRFCQFLYFVLRASIKVKYKPTRFDRHFDRNYHLWFNIGLFWQFFTGLGGIRPLHVPWKDSWGDDANFGMTKYYIQNRAEFSSVLCFCVLLV